MAKQQDEKKPRIWESVTSLFSKKGKKEDTQKEPEMQTMEAPSTPPPGDG